MIILKVKVFRVVFLEKRMIFLFGVGVLVLFFLSLGKIEEYMISKDIIEEGKRLVMFVFYYIVIKDNLILVEYIKKGELENYLDFGFFVMN